MPSSMRQRIELAALLAVGVTPFYLNGFYNARLAENDPRLFWLVDVATWIVLPAILLSVGRWRGLYTAAQLGLSSQVRGSPRPWVLIGLVIAVTYVALRLDIAVVLWARESFPSGWVYSSFQYADVVPPRGPDTGWYRLLALLHLSVTAGVVEELYYRAAFDRLFPRGWVSAVCYVIASSLIFAGAHWEGGVQSLAESFAFGVFAAVVYRATGNVWPLMVGHIVIDWYWFSGGSPVG